MSSFGAFLVGHDYLSAAELEEVTQATVLFGGRLGTAVVEAGLLTLEELDRALAQHLGLPEIPRQWLARPDPAACAALHPELMKRHRCIPLHLEKRTLHAGLVDPRDERLLSELAFASSCLITPYPLSEIRFVELLQRLCGVPASHRFEPLIDTRRRALVAERKAAERRARADVRPAKHERFELAPLAADLELVDEATFNALHTPAANAAPAATEPAAWSAPPDLLIEPEPGAATAEAALPAPARPALSLAQREEQLREAKDRTAIIETALDIAGVLVESAALFVVRDGVAAGLVRQSGGARDAIDSILVPMSGDSLLARAASTCAPMRGVPAEKLDRLLARALGRETSAELAVLPIAIGPRVVNLLVVPHAGGPIAATSWAALGALATQVGAAYESVIRALKQNVAKAARPETS